MGLISNPSFSSWMSEKSELLFDYSTNKFPTKLYGINGEHTLVADEGSTYYVFLYKGRAYIDDVPVKPLQYCCVTEGSLKFQPDAKAIVVERIGVKALPMLGGPIESRGRLKYIDGCSDSLIIPPVKLGDPCFNHLHFPKGIDQTQHTHPSMRVGMVVKGSGLCITPFGNIDLHEGQIFIIHEDTGLYKLGLDGKEYLEGTHSFKTFDGPMDVIAYHPDSDFGPTDEDHPMINRTIVEGRSVKFDTDILTKELID